MLKKLLIGVFAFVMVFSFTACGDESETDKLKGEIATLQEQIKGLSNYNDADLKARILALETAVGSLPGNGDLLSRITALETALGGLSNYDDSSLIGRIAALEKHIFGSDTLPVYNMGESFTLVSNGIKLLTIKYVSAQTTELPYEHTFLVTNHNLHSSQISLYLTRAFPTTSSLSIFNSSFVIGMNTSEEIIIQSGTTESNIYFGYFSNTMFLPYVVFRI